MSSRGYNTFGENGNGDYKVSYILYIYNIYILLLHFVSIFTIASG